jgi:integrase
MDINFDLGIWTIPEHKNKSRKRKRLPISDKAVLLLRAMETKQNSAFVFPTSNGTAMTDINKPWKWLRKETGLTDLRIHDLRHSFASMLVSSGETLETIGKLLGHSQYQTTMRYAHLMDDPLRRAVTKFSEEVSK